MLEQIVRNLPNTAGVYQYFDKNRKLLYVGKAKSLKNRVKSYFRFSPSFGVAKNLSPRITMMISQTAHLEYIIVDSEHDALILENTLIKQLKPKYNILMRDDKTYPYIYIDLGLDFPRFEITRKLVKGKNIHYFGPFSAGSRELLNALYLNFPLVQKKGCEKSKKACLFHQINRCNAPCIGKISKEKYHEMISAAISLIHQPKKLCDALHVKMIKYAEEENYEEAAAIRDMIKSIEAMKQTNIADLAKLEDFDLFTVTLEEKIACALRLFIRDGKVIGSSHNIIHANEGFEEDEIYRQMILDAYPKDSPLPIKTIYTTTKLEDSSILEEAIKALHVKRVEIKTPHRGEKRKLCNLAIINAKELIKKHQNQNTTKLQNEIKEYFELSSYPQSIEVFDNSHLNGVATVGGMICYENGKFNKAKYKHIHLKAKDEYGQMMELLTRRAKHFEDWGVPDLWIIDGGKTLLNLANEVLQSSGIHVDTLAIAKEKVDAKAHRAKGKANDIVHSLKREYKLINSDKKLQFIQLLRDEAHRFAITFHRKTKRKMDKEHSILKQNGIKEPMIKKLLNFYGTFENIYNTNYEELLNFVGQKEAKKIFLILENLTKR